MQNFLRSGIGFADRFSSSLSAHIAMRVTAMPFSPSLSSREKAQLHQANKGIYVNSRGKASPYWTFGEGPVVILCHGWQGRGSHLATMAMAIAEAGFKSVIFDHTAHGDAPGRTSDFETVANDILALSRMFTPIHCVVGHSLGGMMSMYGRRLGLNPDRFVLLGSACAPYLIINKMRELLGVSPKAVALCQTKIANQFGVSWKQLCEGDIYRQCKHPVLMIYDREDEELLDTQAHTEVILSHCTSAKLFSTRGLGHYKILWDSTTIEEVVSFLTP